MIAFSRNTRHCERSGSEAGLGQPIQGGSSAALDCFVASLLAMTIQSQAMML
jgi:hypothetical protein